MCFIDGSAPPPPHSPATSDGSTTANPDFQRGSVNYCLDLQLHVSAIQDQVINYETSYQMWRTLQQLYSSQSLARVLELKL
jgi:hypothetical protein